MIRILFVDDEVNVLSAMRRSLHGMRAEWSMEFAASGAAALQALAREPADVIVSDMRMPGMDGWQLLAEVKQLYPKTVRLVLSGHADPGSIMRSVGTTHQYLAKPCDSSSLKAAITQTQQMRHLLGSDRLATLVGEVGMLPSAPLTFQNLLLCLQSPSSSIADVADIVEGDVAMTANFLKLVNSAFFGSRQPINTPERAVTYLGMDTVGALVLAHGVFHSGAMNEAGGFHYENLWTHSLQTAAAARAIARIEKCSATRVEEAFLTGVLHDVGKIVLAMRGSAAPTASVEEGCSDAQAHHAEVGAYLLGLWGFPTPIVEAVAFHHTPSLAAGDGLSLAGIIHVADRLVHQRNATDATFDLEIEAGLLERCGLVQRLPQWTLALNSLNNGQAPS
jgi:putative nucleotidyltransferase with HDIG domain